MLIARSSTVTPVDTIRGMLSWWCALEAYGALPTAAMARIEFFARCAVLEDLAFGNQTGRREYVTNAERSFGWLFPQRGRAAQRP
jgi:hypothetical protein